jgi:hypothetical protein
MKEFLLVLIGGICSAIGGCIAIWYQAKKARQIRMEEVRGEQQLEACKKALSLIGSIQVILVAKTTEDVLNFLYDNGEWLSMNQILLPHPFVENWKSIRVNLHNLRLSEQAMKEMPHGAERNKEIEDAVKTGEYIRKLAREAEDGLRKEMNLPEIKIKTPDKEKE